MRKIIAAAGLAVMLAGPAGAKVIASCGPLAGHGYYFPLPWTKPGELGWEEEQLNSTSVLVKSGETLDLIITGRKPGGGGTWTRSASDYGAPVVKVGGSKDIWHVLVAWGPDTELYSFDLKRKQLALTAHKTGLLDLARVLVGPCE